MPDYLHYDANYLLIVDNLADFAHLAFVHRHTLGGSEEYAFKTKPVEVERQPRGFRVKRMHMNAEVPPFHRKVVRNDARIDRWNVGTMHIPGIFFLESGFLAILVFGWDRVSARMHFFSTIMVALGATFSSVWIVIANSWQQTPAGHHLVTVDGFTRAEIVDFWALVFNPSSMPRLGWPTSDRRAMSVISGSISTTSI